MRLPLAAVVLATVLTASGGLGSEPLIIVGVVVAYLTVQVLEGLDGSAESPRERAVTAGNSESAATPSR